MSKKRLRMTIVIRAEDMDRTPMSDCGFEDTQVLNSVSQNDAHMVETAITDALKGVGDKKAKER